MTTETFLPRTAGHEDEIALSSPEATRTWGELEVTALRLANGLRALGLGDEDRVAVMSRNRVEFVEVILGTLRGGLRVVPVNWHLTALEAAYILADSDAKVLICDLDNAEVARKAAAEAGVAEILVMGDSYGPWLAAQSDAEPANRRSGGPMFYTSGTTGRPKGVLNRSRETTVEDLWALWRRLGGAWHYGPHKGGEGSSGGSHLIACPIYHAAPYVNIIFAIAYGQSVVVMPRFDAEDFLRQVDAHGITSSHVVPTQLARLLRLPDEVKARTATGSLELLIHGAAPCPRWVKQGIIEWLGPVLVEYYAFSEGAGSCFVDSTTWLERPGTVGRPAKGSEVMAADDTGRPVPQGEVGTLYFRREGQPLPEYHKAPEKTAANALPGGWFTVGDVGRIDADGYVFLADRKIDMIISGGVNIYPAEVEAALSEHPEVADCAVFGVPDEEWGEAVKAAVALTSGATAEEPELIAWCRERIATFKCPTSVDVHDSLPREASGKLMKRKLRDPYWEGKSRRI